MKNKLFTALLAAVSLAAAALPASAQEFRGDGYRQDFRDFRSPRTFDRAEIVVRQDGREVSFDRSDRMFYRLMDRPFNFQPGMTYVYTDRCWRNGCVVLAFAPFSRGPVMRTWAPRLSQFLFYAGGRDGRYNDRGDGRWIDRDHDGRFDRDRDYRVDGRDDPYLQGAPR